MQSQAPLRIFIYFGNVWSSSFMSACSTQQYVGLDLFQNLHACICSETSSLHNVPLSMQEHHGPLPPPPPSHTPSVDNHSPHSKDPPSYRCRLVIDPTWKCQIDILSASIRGSVLSGPISICRNDHIVNMIHAGACRVCAEYSFWL